MPPKALKQILFPIESSADFLEKIDAERNKICGKPVTPSGDYSSTCFNFY